MLLDSLSEGQGAAVADVGVVVLCERPGESGDSTRRTNEEVRARLTDKGQELRDESVRDIESVVLPDARREARVLGVLVVDSDPDLARVVEVGQVQRLRAESEEEVSSMRRCAEVC